MHHAYTDTEKDPHSPKHFKNLFAMMRHTAKIYSGLYRKTIVPEQRFVKNIPEWDSFDRWAGSRTSKLIWVILYVAFYFIFSPSLWFFLLLPVHVLMGPVHGVIINWFAHKYGYINFKMKNTSRNLVPVDLVMLGEAYHNDHHQFPSAINFGVKWYQVDPVYYVILLLNKLRIISVPDLKPVPQLIPSERK
jgi:stearoyl-CoA desaturase (delta-9 desaturase)